MALPAFDTHAYIKRLKLAGFTDEQAEAQSELGVTGIARKNYTERH